MSYISYEEKQTAEENLKKAFRELRSRHSLCNSSHSTLDYRGISSFSWLYGKYKTEIDDLIRQIEKEERDCDDYLQRYCHEFHAATANSRTTLWRAGQNDKQEEGAIERIQKATDNIDGYTKRRSSELSQGFFAGVTRRGNVIKNYGDDLFRETEANLRASFEEDEESDKQEKEAKKRIKKAVDNIDSYVARKSSELSQDFSAGVNRKSNAIKTYGLGRPWGTEIRQRLTSAVGLSNEVNSL